MGSSLLPLPLGSPASPPSGDPPQETRPNILLIVADDLGLEQLECYDPGIAMTMGIAAGPNQYTGAYPYAPTPNITALAASGVRFTRCYTSSTCSPTRASLMTGKYAFRTGIGAAIQTDGMPNDCPDGFSFSANANQQHALSLEEITLPRLIAEVPPPSGLPPYEMAYFGKWHLTADPSDIYGVGQGLPPDGTASVPVEVASGDDHPVLCGWPLFVGLVPSAGERPNPVADLDPSLLLPGATNCPPPGFDLICRTGYRSYFKVTSQPATKGGQPTVVSSRVASNQNDPDEYLTTVQRRDVENWIVSRQAPWLAVWASSAPHGPFSQWPPGGARNACLAGGGVPCVAPLPAGMCSPCTANSFPGNPVLADPMTFNDPFSVQVLCENDLHNFGCEPLDGWTLSSATQCELDNWTRYRAILEAFDTELGKLLARLETEGILEDTMVLFMSDNGTPLNVAQSAHCQVPNIMQPYVPCPDVAGCLGSADGMVQPTCPCTQFAPPTTPLARCGFISADPACNDCLTIDSCNRFKSSPYVTGTNVPLIVSGPMVTVAGGSVIDELIDSVDVYDTIRQLAGMTVAQRDAVFNAQGSALPDGQSFVPLLVGNNSGARDFSLALNYRRNGLMANRDGHAIAFTNTIVSGFDGQMRTYRLVRRRSAFADACPAAPNEPCSGVNNILSLAQCSDELYDLDSDPLEATPLATTDPLFVADYAVVVANLINACPDCTP